MSEDQIKYMVNRFLSWRLPETFSPDAGISFEPTFNKGTPYEMKHQPVGTNLFDYREAEAMVRHMVEGMPNIARQEGIKEGMERAAKWLRTEMKRIGPDNANNVADAMLAELRDHLEQQP